MKETKRLRYIETTCHVCGQPIIMERTKFGYRLRDYGAEFHSCNPEPTGESVVVEPYYPDERCWQWKLYGLPLTPDELAAMDYTVDVCERCHYNKKCGFAGKPNKPTHNAKNGQE